MARVRMEDILDELKPDIRRALAYALSQSAPDAEVDVNALFRSFKRAVGRRCGTWANVPDRYVEKD